MGSGPSFPTMPPAKASMLVLEVTTLEGANADADPRRPAKRRNLAMLRSKICRGFTQKNHTTVQLDATLSCTVLQWKKIAKDLLGRVQLRWLPPLRGAKTLDDVTQKSLVLGLPCREYRNKLNGVIIWRGCHKLTGGSLTVRSSKDLSSRNHAPLFLDSTVYHSKESRVCVCSVTFHVFTSSKNDEDRRCFPRSRRRSQCLCSCLHQDQQE